MAIESRPKAGRRAVRLLDSGRQRAPGAGAGAHPIAILDSHSDPPRPEHAMKCLVILPTYNELDNLPTIIPAILAQGEHFHVLVVDDNSPDGTGRLADELAAANPRVAVLHRTEKRGLGTAYVEGFKQALAQGYEFVYEMDAD